MAKKVQTYVMADEGKCVFIVDGKDRASSVYKSKQQSTAAGGMRDDLDMQLLRTIESNGTFPLF